NGCAKEKRCADGLTDSPAGSGYDAGMIPNQARQLTPHEIRRLATLAFVCERTVRRYLEGQPVRPSGRLRIEAALRDRDARHEGQHGDGTVKPRAAVAMRRGRRA